MQYAARSGANMGFGTNGTNETNGTNGDASRWYQPVAERASNEMEQMERPRAHTGVSGTGLESTMAVHETCLFTLCFFAW